MLTRLHVYPWVTLPDKGMVFFSSGMSWLGDLVVLLTLGVMGPLTSCEFRPQKGAEVTELVMGREAVETYSPTCTGDLCGL